MTLATVAKLKAFVFLLDMCFCICFANSSFTKGQIVSTAQFGEGGYSTVIGDLII